MTEMMLDDYHTVCVVVLGMAGTGKTTFVKGLADHLTDKDQEKPFILNLDPAVYDYPYKSNVDIRKSVNYKNLMEQYNLGPNGAIITALNLYATSFDKVMQIIEKRKSKSRYVLIDTPGQIEVFTWSASGSVIMECLMKTYPTIIVYLADSERCANPTTFMSNMTHSCSILYKYQLPFILAFNKIDIQDYQYAVKWMKDFEEYGKALDESDEYISNLNRSLSLSLDTYYENIDHVGVSSTKCMGFDSVVEKILKGVQEYHETIKESLCQANRKNISQEQQQSSNSDDKVTADDNLIKVLPNYNFQIEEESDGPEDLSLPVTASRKLNEKDVEKSVKKMTL